MLGFLGVIYGVAVYVFFLGTFLYAIGFAANYPELPKTIDSGAVGDYASTIAIDLAVLGLFAVQHSVMARQGFKRWWTKIVPTALERSTFVLFSTVVLAIVLVYWRPLPTLVWSVETPIGQGVLWALFGLGWAILLTATFLINHFELFGLQQVYENWHGRRITPVIFKTPGLYKATRHPIYLGFVLGFWATPQMSEGHLLFAVATTAYIFIGIFFEERDLIANFGDEYRRYRQRVPMLIPFLKKSGTPMESVALVRDPTD